MSWTLVGIVVTLTHELGVFRSHEDDNKLSTSNCETLLHVRRMLFLYISRFFLRLGCTSVFSQGSHRNSAYTPSATMPEGGQVNHDREMVLSKCIEITKLTMTATGMFSSNPSAIKQLFRTSRYFSLLEHLQPLLALWHSDSSEMSCPTIAAPAQ